MTTARSPAFDHGAALRVPPAHDVRGRARLWQWLGDQAAREGSESDAIKVCTPGGWITAWPGDWIILSVAGLFHVTHGRGLD